MGIPILMGIPIPTANLLKRLGLKRCLGFRPPRRGLGLAIAVLPASTPTVLESNLHAPRTQTPQFSSGGYTTQQVVRIASRRHSSDRLLQLAGRMSTRSSRLYNRLYRVNTIQYPAVPCPPRGTQLPQFYEPHAPGVHSYPSCKGSVPPGDAATAVLMVLCSRGTQLPQF